MWNLTALPSHTKQSARPPFARRSLLVAGWFLVLIVPALGWGGKPITLANVTDPGQIAADEPTADIEEIGAPLVFRMGPK